MNLILFPEPFTSIRLPAEDPRARHIREVLRGTVGTLVFVGFAGGLRARAEVGRIEPDGALQLTVVASEPAPHALPIDLLVGLPRPHTARRILFEMASMGVSGLHFFGAEKSDPSYSQSRLWSGSEWRERLRLGAEQSFGTHLPAVHRHADLSGALGSVREAGALIALDNYEAAGPLSAAVPDTVPSLCLALGPERGWSRRERDELRGAGYALAHLGPRVLRLETACVAAVGAAAALADLCPEQTVTRL